MKKLVLAALLGLTALSAIADSGPYYLSSTGYCNIRKFYLTSTGVIYGKEVGCTSTQNWTFTGYYGGGSTFSVTRMDPSNSSQSPSGSLNLMVYDLGSYTMYSYASDGTSSSLANTVSYTFSMTKPSNAFANLPDLDDLHSPKAK